MFIQEHNTSWVKQEKGFMNIYNHSLDGITIAILSETWLHQKWHLISMFELQKIFFIYFAEVILKRRNCIFSFKKPWLKSNSKKMDLN